MLYRPAVLGVARLHYIDKKTGTDYWQTLGLLRPAVSEPPSDLWTGAEGRPDQVPELSKTPEPGGTVRPLTWCHGEGQIYADYTKGLKNYLYRQRKDRLVVPNLKAYSHPEEFRRDFRLRLSQGSSEARDRANAELRTKYAAKRNELQEDIRKAREKLDREQAQASQAKWDAAGKVLLRCLMPFSARKQSAKPAWGKPHPLPRQPARPCNKVAI